jgi:N-carbamoyl-L-amino-acid hydrolase
MMADLETALPAAAARSRCEIAIAERWGFGGFAFDAGLIGLIREAAAEIGAPTMDLKSEAGHDSYHLASICPAAMIFTPCKDGITHNEAEDTTLADQLPGANVLLRVALARACR